MLAMAILIIGIVLYLVKDGKPSRVGEIMIWNGFFGVIWFYGVKAIL